MIDADGSTILLDLFDEFGATKTEQILALSDDTLKVQNAVVDQITRQVEEKLDGLPYTGIEVVCGNAFFDAFIAHPRVEESWLRYQESNLVNDMRTGFNYGGVSFVNYKGSRNGNPLLEIAPDQALAIPMGVPELFIARYAPADYNETVNTIGLDFYAKSETMKFDKGMEIESQTNPIFLCTRPETVVHLTLG